MKTIDVFLNVNTNHNRPSAAPVHDALRLFLPKDLLDGGYVCDIRFEETEVTASLKAIQARLLERDIVIIIEIVDAQNFVPAINKPMRDMRTDEARGSCDKNFHLWNQSEPDDKQHNILGKNHKNIQKADFVIRLGCFGSLQGQIASTLQPNLIYRVRCL
jgi:hypothetical protein